jgi:hypothetical protein
MRWVPLAVLVLGGCGGPSGEAVRADFMREHPRAVVVSADPGEGDSEHAYYHIRFRVPPDTTLQETVWAYRRAANGTWRVFHRGPASPELRN